MKKSLAMFGLMTFLLCGVSIAEEAAAPEAVAMPEAVIETPVVEAPAVVVEAPVLEEIAPEPQDTTLVDNLEFISGEVSEMDEAGKTVSVRLYGENEDAASDKVLKVSVDENTDITDGEQDRDLKSLSAGTEVDVEYDPATNKATYIFVY